MTIEFHINNSYLSYDSIEIKYSEYNGARKEELLDQIKEAIDNALDTEIEKK
jgi:hypothetical protein